MPSEGSEIATMLAIPRRSDARPPRSRQASPRASQTRWEVRPVVSITIPAIVISCSCIWAMRRAAARCSAGATRF